MTANKEQMQSESEQDSKYHQAAGLAFDHAIAMCGTVADSEETFSPYRDLAEQTIRNLESIRASYQQLVAENQRLMAENEALCRGMKLAADHLGYVGDWYESYPIVKLIEVNRRLRAEAAKIRQANNGRGE